MSDKAGGGKRYLSGTHFDESVRVSFLHIYLSGWAFFRNVFGLLDA